MGLVIMQYELGGLPEDWPPRKTRSVSVSSLKCISSSGAYMLNRTM